MAPLEVFCRPWGFAGVEGGVEPREAGRLMGSKELCPSLRVADLHLFNDGRPLRPDGVGVPPARSRVGELLLVHGTFVLWEQLQGSVETPGTDAIAEQRPNVSWSVVRGFRHGAGQNKARERVVKLDELRERLAGRLLQGGVRTGLFARQAPLCRETSFAPSYCKSA
jgi:hypothetical protein